MQLRRRKVTIQFDHYKLRVGQDSPESPVDASADGSASGLTHSPPERRSSSVGSSQKHILPPEETD